MTAAGKGLNVVVDVVDNTGKPLHYEYTVTYDRQDVTVKGDPSRDTTAMKRIDDLSLRGWPEMAFREGASGTGFQVTLEPDSLWFRRKLHRHHNRSRTVRDRKARRAVVMPLEPFVHIARITNVVSTRIRVASKDVYETFSDSSHQRS